MKKKWSHTAEFEGSLFLASLGAKAVGFLGCDVEARLKILSLLSKILFGLVIL